MSERILSQASVILLLLLFCMEPLSAQRGEGGVLIREYFVRQGEEEPLVIRVNPFEAEFQVRVTGPDGIVLRESGLPSNRTLPLFLFIDADSQERQLDIVVEAPWHTNQTRFELEFSRLDVRDELSGRLARAYQLFSQGEERLQVETAANWSVKANMLVRAGRLFADFGMEEQRLWALLAAAHLVQNELGDPDTALEWCNEAIAAARLSALPDPEFAGVVLRAEILHGRSSVPSATAADKSAARDALEQAGRMARSRDDLYEAAYMRFLLGQELADVGSYRDALQQFQQSLDTLLERDAGVLAAEVRKQMVAAHEQLGNVVATEQVLERMVEQLADGGAQDELVRGLLAQGRLYLDLFRYPDAARALERSLAVDDVSLTRTQATIMLGEALYESGRFAEAKDALLQALINPETGLFRRPNPLLPLASGLEMLANIYRLQGQHEDAQRTRAVQGRHLESARDATRWALQRVLDAVAAGRIGVALDRLREGGQSARETASSADTGLGLLAICAATGDSVESCKPAAFQAAFDKVSRGSGPRQELAARFYRAQYASLSGWGAAAADDFRWLLRQVHFYRSELPGVLGSWYWAHQDALFLRALASLSGASATAAMDSFAAAVRILAIGRTVAAYSGDDPLRSQIGQGTRGWRAEIEARAGDFARRTNRFSDNALRAWLRGLESDEAVLVILVEGENARIWLAGPGGVRYFRQTLPAGFDGVLAALRDNPLAADRARAGSTLFAGMGDLLPRTVYWLPVGELIGVGLGELRFRGREIAAGRDIIALVDFPAAERPQRPLPAEWPGQVFLAGDPVDWTSSVPERLAISAEMNAVRDHFIGQGLHMLQGSALLADEFRDPRLASAGLVHLALPARIDLREPEQSAFELSEPGRGQGRQQLVPGNARTWLLEADLFVLGQVEYLHEPSGRYASRIGLVSDLVDAGAARIIACRRNLADAAARYFRLFYADLLVSRDISAAMRQGRDGSGLAPTCQLYGP